MSQFSRCFVLITNFKMRRADIADDKMRRSDIADDKMRRSDTGLHNSFHPTIRDGSTWSKFGARGEHGDFFLFSNLGAL